MTDFSGSTVYDDSARLPRVGSEGQVARFPKHMKRNFRSAKAPAAAKYDPKGRSDLHAVVKVQLSVLGTSEHSSVLITSEDGSIAYQTEQPELVALFRPGEFKFFYNAIWHGSTTGEIELIDEAPWQDW